MPATRRFLASAATLDATAVMLERAGEVQKAATARRMAAERRHEAQVAAQILR